MSPNERTSYSQKVADALRDRYDIDRVIGRGGMSIVFLARDRNLDRRVAIKVMDPESCSQVGAERFLREVRITAPLQHPNILPLIDSGAVGDIVYSVMPFVEGESVRDRLVREGPLAVEDALLTAREVADALDYAHKRGIVHRDIKPENILLSNGQAVVADFGIARATNLATELTLSGTGMPIGTPAYMSPEQVRGREAVDARSDIYSLGVTLYEMLAGRPPFVAQSVTEVLSMHLEQEPQPLERRRPELPDRVIGIVTKAMAKRPAERHQSAAELAADLREALGEPARYPTPTGGSTSSRPGVRSLPGALRPARASGWLVLIALVLAIVALVLVSRPPGGDRVAESSLAVLPFTAKPPGSVAEYWTEGLASRISARLASYRGLQVTAQASAIAVSDQVMSPAAIGDTLGVEYLLRGEVSPLDSAQFRATVRLVRTSDGSTSWQRVFTVNEARLDRDAAQIAELAAAELVAGSPPPPAHFGRDSEAALTDALLLGRYWLARATPEALARARTAFTRAVELDSTSVEAYAGLARARVQTVLYGFRGTDDLYGELAQAVLDARKAVALDSTNPEALLVLARTAHFTGVPPDSASRIYRRVLAASPNIPEALLDLGHLRADLGQRDSAIALARQAVLLDPLSPPIRHGAIAAALAARQPAVALEWSRARLAQDPGDNIARGLEAYSLPLVGRATECTMADFGPWLAAAATCLHAAGRVDEAQTLADSLGAMLEREQYITVHQFTDLATYYAWTGRAQESLRWLERAAAHTPHRLEWVIGSGLYDPVLSDPEFRQGLERIERQTRDRLQARWAMLSSGASGGALE